MNIYIYIYIYIYINFKLLTTLPPPFTLKSQFRNLLLVLDWIAGFNGPMVLEMDG